MTVHWVLLVTVEIFYTEIIFRDVKKFRLEDQLPLLCFSLVLRDPGVVTAECLNCGHHLLTCFSGRTPIL